MGKLIQLTHKQNKRKIAAAAAAAAYRAPHRHPLPFVCAQLFTNARYYYSEVGIE